MIGLTSASGREKPGRVWVNFRMWYPFSLFTTSETSPTCFSENAAATTAAGYAPVLRSKNARSPPRGRVTSSSEWRSTSSRNAFWSARGSNRFLFAFTSAATFFAFPSSRTKISLTRTSSGRWNSPACSA